MAAADTFEAVAREWHAKHSPRWVASHASKVLRRPERDVFPWVGEKQGCTHRVRGKCCLTQVK